MESILSINGVAQVADLIGLPALVVAVLLAAIVLTGAAERMVLLAEDIGDRIAARSTEPRH